MKNTDLIKQMKFAENEILKAYEAGEIYEYICSVLDIEVYSNLKKEYNGAKIAITLGGPNIYINTRYEIIEGFWGGSNISYPLPGEVINEIDNTIDEWWNNQPKRLKGRTPCNGLPALMRQAKQQTLKKEVLYYENYCQTDTARKTNKPAIFLLSKKMFAFDGYKRKAVYKEVK